MDRGQESNRWGKINSNPSNRFYSAGTESTVTHCRAPHVDLDYSGAKTAFMDSTDSNEFEHHDRPPNEQHRSGCVVACYDIYLGSHC